MAGFTPKLNIVASLKAVVVKTLRVSTTVAWQIPVNRVIFVTPRRRSCCWHASSWFLWKYRPKISCNSVNQKWAKCHRHVSHLPPSCWVWSLLGVCHHHWDCVGCWTCWRRQFRDSAWITTCCGGTGSTRLQPTHPRNQRWCRTISVTLRCLSKSFFVVVFDCSCTIAYVLLLFVIQTGWLQILSETRLQFRLICVLHLDTFSLRDSNKHFWYEQFVFFVILQQVFLWTWSSGFCSLSSIVHWVRFVREMWLFSLGWFLSFSFALFVVWWKPERFGTLKTTICRFAGLSSLFFRFHGRHVIVGVVAVSAFFGILLWEMGVKHNNDYCNSNLF